MYKTYNFNYNDKIMSLKITNSRKIYNRNNYITNNNYYYKKIKI